MKSNLKYNMRDFMWRSVSTRDSQELNLLNLTETKLVHVQSASYKYASHGKQYFK